MQFPGLILVQPELLPQINPTDVFVGRQARGRAALENDPAVHDVRAIRDAQRLPHIMIGDEHPDPSVAKMENDLLDIGDRNRIDSGERLVKEDELRLR